MRSKSKNIKKNKMNISTLLDIKATGELLFAKKLFRSQIFTVLKFTNYLNSIFEINIFSLDKNFRH